LFLRMPELLCKFLFCMFNGLIQYCEYHWQLTVFLNFYFVFIYICILYTSVINYNWGVFFLFKVLVMFCIQYLLYLYV
jgi:hypothetical protein